MSIEMRFRVSQNTFVSKFHFSSKNISIRIEPGIVLKNIPDGRCLFYDDGCSIYPVRPDQCKTYPFWFENLRSVKKWRRLSRECPGIGCGPLYSKDKILKIVQSTMGAVVKSFFETKKNIS